MLCNLNFITRNKMLWQFVLNLLNLLGIFLDHLLIVILSLRLTKIKNFHAFNTDCIL